MAGRWAIVLGAPGGMGFMARRDEASGDAVRAYLHQQSLSTRAARNLSTTTKSVPQMAGITSRWLLRMLPWVEVRGGAYRVNRRATHLPGDGRVSFFSTGQEVGVVPPSLTDLPPFAGLFDMRLLEAVADRFEEREVAAGAVVAEAGQPITEVLLVAHGKLAQSAPGAFDNERLLDVLGDGEHAGTEVLARPGSTWSRTLRALVRTVLLVLPVRAFVELAEREPVLAGHLAEVAAAAAPAVNRAGELDVAISAGHLGEAMLPTTFVDYELSPREYELSAAQTVLRIHTRVADLYNDPMDQTEQQLRLTIEALKERQEHELVNNPEFGLLHNVDLRQRLRTVNGPPTPDDLDELLTRRRGTTLLFAHPRAIAAFGRECNARGLYPQHASLMDSMVPAWRGVPVLPCTKIPVTAAGTTSILAMRTGEADGGVVGLRQTGLPDELEPGLSVRFMGINEQALISYLVTAYYSVAVLTPDALGVLEDVEVGRR